MITSKFSFFLIFLAVAVADAVIRFDNTTLEQTFCQSETIPNNIVLLSNTTYLLNPGNFCVIENVQSLRICGDSSSSPTIIKCLPQNNSLSSRGFGFVNVINLTIENVRFEDCGGVLSSQAVNFINSSNFYFGPGRSSVLVCNHCTNVNLSNVVITNYVGFAFLGLNVFGESTFDHLSVVNNRKVNTSSHLCHTNGLEYICKGSGILIKFFDTVLSNNSHSSSSVLVSNSNFTDNKASHVFLNDYLFDNCTDIVFFRYSFSFYFPATLPSVGAITVIFEQHFTASVVVKDTSFANNHGQCFGSNAVFFISPPSLSTQNFQNCTFRNNTPLKQDLTTDQNFFGSAVTVYMLFERDLSATYNCLSIVDSEFSRDLNFVYHTTPFLSMSQLPSSIGYCKIHLSNLTSSSDSSFLHAASIEGGRSIRLEMANLKINGLHPTGTTRLNYTNNLSLCNGVIELINVANATLIGTDSHSCVFSDLIGPVIASTASSLFLTGNISFSNNHGSTWVDGTVIRLMTNSYLFLKEPANVLFENNTAISGGAIYSAVRSTPFCTIQYSTENVYSEKNISKMDVRLTFSHNSAKVSGNSIFIARLYECSVQISEGLLISPNNVTYIYDALFHFENPIDNHLLEMSSIGYSICLCKDSISNTSISALDCTGATYANHPVYTYPGKNFDFKMIVVDRNNQPVYSTIFIVVGRNAPYANELDWNLEYGQYVYQLYPPNCTQINFAILSKNNTGERGELSALVKDVDRRINIPIVLMPCPPGFERATGENACQCSQLFRNVGAVCHIDNYTVTRPLYSWIGITTQGHENTSRKEFKVGYSNNCPIEYCSNASSSGSREVNMSSPSSSLCFPPREGILCGQCPLPYSTVIGGNDCRICTNWYLLMIPLYALAGIGLVVILFVLRITVTTGTINGLVFYANLIYVTKVVFLGIPELSWLRFFIGTINLRLGFPICLYDGLNTVVSSHLAYLFPLYLWFIAFVLVVLCKYSDRVSHRIGRSAVPVLATLIHMSYGTMLASTVDGFSTINVDIEDFNGTMSTKHVWYFDGNITYLSNCHLSLFIFVLVTLVFFLLPYTIVLTGIKFFSRFRIVNRFTPYVDAYCAPYKDKWRFWFGARLWVLVFVYIIYSVLRNDFILLFLIQVIILILFTFLQLIIMPFKSVAINLLDSFFMINSIMLSIVGLYTADLEKIRAASGILIAMALFVFILILAYHIWNVTGRKDPRVCLRIQRSQRNTYNAITTSKLDTSIQDSVQESKVPKSNVVTYQVLSYHPERLREPVMDSDHSDE